MTLASELDLQKMLTHERHRVHLIGVAGSGMSGIAALLLKESDLTTESLAQKIRELIENPNQLRRFAEASAQLAPKNAAALVVETMERYTQPNHDARL